MWRCEKAFQRCESELARYRAVYCKEGKRYWYPTKFRQAASMLHKAGAEAAMLELYLEEPRPDDVRGGGDVVYSAKLERMKRELEKEDVSLHALAQKWEDRHDGPRGDFMVKLSRD